MMRPPHTDQADTEQAGRKTEKAKHQSAEDSIAEGVALSTHADTFTGAASATVTTHDGNALIPRRNKRGRMEEMNGFGDGKRPKCLRFAFGKTDITRTPSDLFQNRHSHWRLSL